MQVYISWLSVFLFFNALVLILLGFHMLSQKNAKGAFTFGLIMFSTAIWAYAVSMESVSLSIEERVFWSQVSYIGIVTVSPLWFIFSLRFAQYRLSTIRKINYVIWLVPAIVLLLAFTNNSHHLLWSGFEMNSQNILDGIYYKRNFLFYINVVYSYSFLLLGSIVLSRYLLKVSGEHKRQIIILLLSMFVPWIANILYVILAPRNISVELTPLVMSITGSIIVFGVFKYRFLRALPLAKATIYKNIASAIVITDIKGKIIDFNLQAKNVLGEELAVGIELESYRGFERLSLGEIYKHEGVFNIYHDSSKRWFDINVSKYVDKLGAELGKIMIFYDVTELKRYELEIDKSRHFLADVIDFLPDPTFAIDAQSKVTIWNKAIAKLTGVRKEDIIAKGDYIYALPFYESRRPMLIDLAMQPTRDPVKEGLYKEVKRDADTITAEIFNTVLTKSGAYFWGTAKPLYDEDKNIIGAIETIRDITDRKKIEMDLKAKVDQLVTMNRVMTDRELKMVELKEQLEKLEEGGLGAIKPRDPEPTTPLDETQKAS